MDLSRLPISGVILGRRSDRTIAKAVRRARSAALSYDHAGSTLGRPPGGLVRSEVVVEVPGALADAADRLRRWATHTGIRAEVLPPGPPVPGASVCIVVPFGPFEMLVADRIVAVVDDPVCVGVAYGTLAGHPESGEELFLAEQVEPGRLRLTIRIDARIAGRAARAVAPLSRHLQMAAARRYLDAWASALVDPSSPGGP